MELNGASRELGPKGTGRRAPSFSERERQLRAEFLEAARREMGCAGEPMRERRDIAARLRPEDPPGGDVLVIRGGPDTPETLAQDAARTAEFWALEGVPLLGISVFAVLGMPFDQLLRDRLSRFSVIHRLQVSYLGEFRLLPTFRSPHFTIRLQHADAWELSRLPAALGAPVLNPKYHEVS